MGYISLALTLAGPIIFALDGISHWATVIWAVFWGIIFLMMNSRGVLKPAPPHAPGSILATAASMGSSVGVLLFVLLLFIAVDGAVYELVCEI